MTTLDESVNIAYRSSAVAYAAAKTKRIIAADKLKEARVLKRQLLGSGTSREDPVFVQNEKRKVLWENLKVAQRYAMQFYVIDSATIQGVKPRLEALWVQMGNSVATLEDWDTLANTDLKTVISFRSFQGNMNLQGVLDTEAVFTGNSSEIPTTDFETQFEEMFDLFVNDIYASEGMREWTRDELNRGPESAADLAVWDSINDDAGVFFANAVDCVVKNANLFAQFELGGPNEASYIARYTKGQGNRYNAVNGLFALDPSDLPSNQYRNRVENKKVTVR
ncbi:MAG: hypothetical protein QNJ81_02265 [Acidimicrobiia bacterium]|nr:hypothetical protein [Acidimicrobiia bacterium]